MKNIDQWRETKFELKNGTLRASRNPDFVSRSSRFVVDLVAIQFQAHLKDHVKGKLIDLGCGNVPLFRAYSPYCTEVTCTDWENSKHVNPYLDFTCDLNQPLPLENAVFDTIILSDVLEHLQNPKALWNEMNRILKPGGKVILNVPFFYKLHETPHDFFRYTRYALQNFAEETGFKVIAINEVGGLPEVLTDLMTKLFVHFPLLGKFLSGMIQGSGNWFGRTGLGKNLTRKTQKDFPLGYFMIAEKIR